MISVITPTIGRDSLRTMLGSLLPQLSGADEVLVVGDGPQPNAMSILDGVGSRRVRYWETLPVRNFGNPQRNEAIKSAKGKYLFFVDDDDIVAPGAVASILRAAARCPDSPLMFKMQHPRVVIWGDPKVRQGNVSGQMFVCPNVPGRVGRWSGRYEADFDFISSTLALYPAGEKALAWRQEILVVQGLAGKNGSGGREIL